MNKKRKFGVFKSDLGNSLTPMTATENCAFNTFFWWRGSWYFRELCKELQISKFENIVAGSFLKSLKIRVHKDDPL